MDCDDGEGGYGDDDGGADYDRQSEQKPTTHHPSLSNVTTLVCEHRNVVILMCDHPEYSNTTPM